MTRSVSNYGCTTVLCNKAALPATLIAELGSGNTLCWILMRTCKYDEEPSGASIRNLSSPYLQCCVPLGGWYNVTADQ
jgi:hypothetical protein